MLEEVDLARLEEQVSELVPSLRRFDALRGAAREMRWAAFHLAVWPIGLVDVGIRNGATRLRAVTLNSNGRRPKKEASEIPILLVHGYFHNRSGFMVMQRAFRKHGFSNVFALNYNPLRKGIPEIAQQVACKVDEIIADTGSKKVHIVGHSLGGLLARYYIEQMGGCSKVHTLITLGTPHRGTIAAYLARSATAKQMRPGSEFLRTMGSRAKSKKVRYVSYYSNLDALVVPWQSAILEGPNVKNILIKDHGHLSLLISPELIQSMAHRLSEPD